VRKEGGLRLHSDLHDRAELLRVLRSLGAVGSAGALPFAAVLTGMLSVATALALAGILPLTGMLGRIRCRLCEQETCNGG
jgi:hypothetical protein